jgi:hypothetical protein
MRFAVPQADRVFWSIQSGLFFNELSKKGVPVTNAFTIDDLEMSKNDWAKCA